MRSALIILLIALFPSLALAETLALPHLPPDPELWNRDAPGERTPPPGWEIVNPAEFCPAAAMTIGWPGWGEDYLADLVRPVAEDDLVYVVVANVTQKTQAENYLAGSGVNMANVEFVIHSTLDAGGMWIRDYGPFCATDDGIMSIMDFYYGVYNANDAVPASLAAHMGMPCYESPLLHHGGNHLTDGNGMGFCSTNITLYNGSWSEEEIRQEFRDYLGIDSLVIFTPMLDETGHCDMMAKLLGDTLFIVGEYENEEDGRPGDKQRLDDIAALLDGLQNLDGRDFEVARIPMLPAYQYSGYWVNRTYTNSLILNDKVLVPVYGDPMDAVAQQIYADHMPGHEIIGIDSAFIIEWLGAIHCTTNTIHADDPLMVLHKPLESIYEGTQPFLRFRLNPRFADMSASVWWKRDSEGSYTEAPASFAGGAWTVALPAADESFSYYIEGGARSGLTNFDASLPLAAPAEAFHVTVTDPTGAPVDGPAALRLAAWPNPFNPHCSLSFSLDRAARVSLDIFDVSGRRVASLLKDEALASGDQQLSWHGRDEAGRDLPSGLYLARILVEDGRTETRRLMLLR